jgi:ribosome-associated protein
MDKRIEKITAVLDKNKADAIEVFDLKEKDYFVDSVVIATSLNARHTEALLNHLKTELKPAEQFLGVDISDEWIVIDLGDILIHIMTPEYRVKYNIEEFLSKLAAQQRDEIQE